jgi:hypothetical protein
MGFLDSFLGMFGVGQPKLALQCGTTSVGPGGLIEATLTLTGGKRALPLGAFTLAVRQTKQVTRSDGTKGQDFETLGEVVVPMGGLEVAPGQVVTFKMRMQVPKTATASTKDLTHKLTAAGVVPGLDASADQPLTITSTEDRWAAEDLSQYHVVEQPLHNRHSSVKSDFRLLRLKDGVVATWKSELSARDLSGSQRWRLPGWGRSFTLSPDGTKLLVSNDSKELGVVDVATGALTAGPHPMTKWPGDLAWLPGEALVVGTDEGIQTLQPSFFPIGVSFGGDTYVGGVAASAGKQYFASYPNSNVLKWSEVPAGEVGKLDLQGAGDILPSQDGTVLAVRGHDEFHLVSVNSATHTLKLIRTVKVPGLKGTRHFGQEEHSSTRFEPMPRVADDNQRVLCQDGSGQLYLLDKGGKPFYVWPREVVDQVEDTCWVGAEEFLALTNDGRVLKLSTKGGPAAWAQQDI